MSEAKRKLINWIGINHSLPIQVDITNHCNLRCKHCYHADHVNVGALGIAEWFSILDQYYTLIQELSYQPEVIVCGGEPMISPNLIPILEYVFKKNPETSVIVLTNGTNTSILKSNIFKTFKNIRFQVSLDGPNEETHDAVRGRGNFSKALEGIKKLVEAGFEVSILAVLSKNSSYWIKDFFELASQLKVTAMSFTRMITSGQAKSLVASGEDRALEPNELKAAYIDIIASADRFKLKTSTKGPLWHLLHPSLGSAGNFWEAIIVSYQGFLLASSRSRIQLGKINNDNLKSLFLTHPFFRKQRKKEMEVCGICKFVEHCGGDRNVAFASSGNFFGKDPGCWYIDNNKIIKTEEKIS